MSAYGPGLMAAHSLNYQQMRAAESFFLSKMGGL
jgi:hypothetical protein